MLLFQYLTWLQQKRLVYICIFKFLYQSLFFFLSIYLSLIYLSIYRAIDRSIFLLLHPYLPHSSFCKRPQTPTLTQSSEHSEPQIMTSSSSVEEHSSLPLLKIDVTHCHQVGMPLQHIPFHHLMLTIFSLDGLQPLTSPDTYGYQILWWFYKHQSPFCCIKLTTPILPFRQRSAANSPSIFGMAVKLNKTSSTSWLHEASSTFPHRKSSNHLIPVIQAWHNAILLHPD